MMASHSIFAIGLLVSCLVFVAVDGQSNPGVVPGVGQSAFTYVKDLMIPLLEKTATTTPFPDLHTRVDTPIGHLNLDLTELNLNTLQIPTSAITLVQPSQISVSVSDISMQMTMKWHYKKPSFPPISDGGHADIRVSKALAGIDMKLSYDNTTTPPLHIAVDQCNVNLASVDISLHGGASWLYNIILSLFQSSLVHSIQSTLCKEIPGQVNQIARQLIATLPTHETILGNYTGLDHHIVDTPIITSSGLLTVPIRAEFYALLDGPGHMPGEPDPIPLTDTTDAMAAVYISDWTLGSFAFALWRSKFLNFVVNTDQIAAKYPKIAPAFISSFFSDVAPGLIKQYGDNAKISMQFLFPTSPKIDADPSLGLGTTINPVLMTVSAWNSTTSEYDAAFTVSVSAQAYALLKVKEDHSIGGTITKCEVTKTELINTLVGDIDVDGFNGLLSFVLETAQSLGQSMLDDGVKLPAFPPLTIIPREIDFRDGHMAVFTDASYNLTFAKKSLYSALKIQH